MSDVTNPTNAAVNAAPNAATNAAPNTAENTAANTATACPHDDAAISFGRRPRVVLVGPPGSGKTTIGRRLASALNCEFIDTDAKIEEREGTPCGTIITDRGEPAFRAIEAEEVAAALRTDGVVSLGGGAVVTDSTRELLDDMTVIFLDVSAAEGVRRTAGDANRPLLAPTGPGTASDDARLSRYQALLDERCGYYRDVADFRVRTDNRSPQQTVGDILGYLDAL